jgi:hypothetical protein
MDFNAVNFTSSCDIVLHFWDMEWQKCAYLPDLYEVKGTAMLHLAACDLQ